MQLTKCNLKVSQPLKDKNGNIILNTIQLTKYIKYADYLLYKTFLYVLQPQGWTINDLSRNSSQPELYRQMLQTFKSDFKVRNTIGIREEIKNDLIKLYDNWDDFKQYHIKYSGLLTVSSSLEVGEDDTNVENNYEEATDEEAEQFMAEIDRRGNSQSTYQLSSSDIRILFRIIPKMRYNPIIEESQEVSDADGLPIMSDSGLFSIIANQLAGLNDEMEFREKISSKEFRVKFPEISKLQELIQFNNADKNLKQMLLYNNFFNTFTLAKVPIWISKMTIKGADTNYDMYEAIKNTLDKIEESYNSNFSTNNIKKELIDKYTNIDNSKDNEGREVGLGRMYITSVPEITPINFADIKTRDLKVLLADHLNFLELLGIKFSSLHLINSDEKERYAKAIDENAKLLRKSLIERLQLNQKIYKPVNDLKKSYSIEDDDFIKTSKSNNRAINTLVALESEYSILQPSLSVKNATDEIEYLLSKHNHLTLSGNSINRAKTLDELYKSPAYSNLKFNPLWKNSFLRKYLFDDRGVRRIDNKISINKYNGFQKDTDIKSNNNTKNLSIRDKFIMDFNAYTKYNIIDIMRTEAKSSFFAMFIESKGNNIPYIHHTEFEKGFTTSEVFRNIIQQYLEGEIERIRSYSIKKQENPHLTERYDEFSIFSFLTPDMKADILKGTHNQESFFNQVEEFFNKELKTLGDFRRNENIHPEEIFNKYSIDKQFLEEGRTIDDKIPNDRKNELFRSFIANTFINNVESSIIFTGDPLFSFEDFHKRLGGIISNGKPTNNTSEFTDFSRNNVLEIARNAKYSLASTVGVITRDNQHTILTAVIPDVLNNENAYTDYNEIPKGIKLSYESRGEKISDEEVRELIADVLNNDGSISFKPIKVTDGAAFTHIDFHRQLSLKNAFWTTELEDAYKYQGLVYKRIKGKINEDEKKELKLLEQKIMISPSKYGIPTLKYAYFGGILNATVDGKDMDKFSLKPILPTDAENNPELLEILDAMVEKQLAYVKHKSGTKIFVRKLFSSVNKIDTSDEKGENYPDVLSTNLLKEQITPHTEEAIDTTLLTQFVSLLFTNMFDDGVAINDNIKNAFNKYKGLFQNLHEIQRKGVESIGISLDEQGNIKGFDASKLVSKINDQLGNLQSNSNVADALHVKDGKLESPIESSGILNQVQDYVLGFLDKTLRRYKIQGGNYIVVTPAYMKNKLKTSKYNPNGTEKMEARITFNEAHKPLLNIIDPHNFSKTIGTLGRLNQLLKDKDFVTQHEKALTITFGRAPIDAPHSMGVATIKEFFHPTAGYVLQLPDEFIKSSGYDFDIDKEKVYFPYINNYTIESVKKQITWLEEEYKELRAYSNVYDDESMTSDRINKVIGDIFNERKELHPDERLNEIEKDANLYNSYKNYIELKENEKNEYINQLLQSFEDVLRLPELYSETVIPNTSKTIKRIANDNAKKLGTSSALPSLANVFLYSSNLKVFRDFLRAQQMLSVFAKGNTQNEFLKQGGLEINQRYIQGKIKRVIRLVLLNDAEKAMVVNNDKIKIGRKYSVDGANRQHLQAQKITITVDAANDPSFADLNFSYYNIGVAEFLDAVSVPFQRIVDFLNNPILLKYYTLRDQGLDRASGQVQILKDLGIYKPGKGSKTGSAEEFAKDLKEGLVLDEIPVYKDGVYTYNVITKNNPSQYILTNIHNGDYKSLVKNTDVLNNVRFPSEISPERLAELKTAGEWQKVGDKNFADNLFLFAYFVETEKHTYNFRAVKSLFDSITGKINSLNDISNINATRIDLLDKGFIDANQLNKMTDNSLPSAFNNNDFIDGILQKIFPEISNKVIADVFIKIISDYNWQKGTTKSNKRSLPKIITNDFLYSIMSNFGEYNNRKFISEGIRLIGKNSFNTTLAEKLASLRNETYYPKLIATYPILSKFETDAADKPHILYRIKNKEGEIVTSIPYNIKFIDGFDLTPEQEEIYVEQIKTLISPDFKFVADGTATPEANKKISEEISDVTKNLLITSLTQAGMSKSMLSFYNLIPPVFVKQILTPAFERFKNLTEEEQKKYMDLFRADFKENNPKFFKPQEPIEAWRGKKYINSFFATSQTTNINNFEQADKLSPIEQNFRDGSGGRTMQPQFKGKSTMDLIISGDRTRTTRANTDIQRMTKDYGLSKISDLVGKVIRMTDKTGQQVYTEITGVFPFTKEYQDQTWQKEGWTKDVTDKLVGQYPYAIEFKVIPTNTNVEDDEFFKELQNKHDITNKPIRFSKIDNPKIEDEGLPEIQVQC